jgi:hypothetical protein
LLITALMTLVLTSGCGAVTEPEELTRAELLSKIEGRHLTQAEVDRQLRLADLLCGFDRRVLQRIWSELDAKQLEFQDFVFGQHCPERSPVYTAARPDLGHVPEDERLVLEIPVDVVPLPASELDLDGGSTGRSEYGETGGGGNDDGDPTSESADRDGTGSGEDSDPTETAPSIEDDDEERGIEDDDEERDDENGPAAGER